MGTGQYLRRPETLDIKSEESSVAGSGGTFVLTFPFKHPPLVTGVELETTFEFVKRKKSRKRGSNKVTSFY